jgi:hypothetical protein
MTGLLSRDVDDVAKTDAGAMRVWYLRNGSGQDGHNNNDPVRGLGPWCPQNGEARTGVVTTTL